MTSKTQSPQTPSPETDEAAAWLVRTREGLDARSQAELRDWLAASPANAQAMNAMLDAWEDLDADPKVARRTRRSAVGVIGGRAAAPAVAVCLLVVAGVWFGTTSTGKFSTGVGEQRQVVLIDGSQIQLDAATHVRVRQTLFSRHVDLTSGRAVFDVAHDARRPFRVRTQRMEVTALGTRFLVGEGADHDDTALLRGRVRVADLANGEHTELVPGQAASAGPGGLSRRLTDPETELAWTQGRIALSGVDLAEAVRRFTPYSAARVALADPRMGAIRVAGSYRTGDQEAFLRATAELNGLKLEHRAPDTWLLSRP